MNERFKNFLENIKPLIEMYYYTDNENLRFIAWVKARPNTMVNAMAAVDNFLKFEASRIEKKWKEWNETDFNNIKEL